MSDDFSAICHHCRTYIHFGQRMAASYSLGHGGDDNNPEVKKEKQGVLKFCMQHAWCNPVLGVQILLTDPFTDNIYHGKYNKVRDLNKDGSNE